MTPEFPRAPRSSADAAVSATWETVTSSPISSRARSAAPMVMDILVPVSPSGTGYTFSSSTERFLFAMLIAADIIASLSSFPFITVCSPL